MTGDGAEPPDRGAARERTTLAWHRTALSAAAAAAVSLRAFAERGPLGLVLAAVLAAVAVVAYLPGPHGAAGASRLRVVAAGVTASAVLAAWLSLS